MSNTKPRRAWQLRIELDGVWPPVWRRVLVSDRCTLPDLHEVIQEIFGWEDCHLHQFNVGEVEYGDPENDEYGDFDIHDETEVQLHELDLRPGESFSYTYDFGDDWKHTLRLEKIVTVEGRKRLPNCLAGQRTCPPEDVGGVGGYAELLEALADPGHPEHDRYLEWIGGSFDAEAFDPAEANRRLSDRAAYKRAANWVRVADRYRNAPLADNPVWGLKDSKVHETTAGDLPLRRDVVSFLNYLRDHKATGSSATGNLPLKAVAEIAAGFVNPPPMEIRVGNSVYPIRKEEAVWPVYFVHLLANGAGLVSGGAGRRWQLTRRGEQFLVAPASLQVRSLLAGWWYLVDWRVVLRYNIFGDAFCSRVPRVALSLLRMLGTGGSVEFEAFVERLIEETGLRWDGEGEQSDRVRCDVGFSLERMLIEPLETLGVIAAKRHTDVRGFYPMEILEAFSLTEFGRALLDTLLY